MIKYSKFNPKMNQKFDQYGSFSSKHPKFQPSPHSSTSNLNTKQNNTNFQVIELQDRQIEGYYSKGEVQGFSKVTHQNGKVYIGEFKNGFRSGFGFQSQNLTQYIGQFLKNYRHGIGQIVRFDELSRESIQNQNIFENSLNKSTASQGISVIRAGNFVKGLQSGFGFLENFESSDSYIGHFEGGYFSGYGIQTSKDKTHFIGSFKEGVRDGVGIEQGRSKFRGYYSNGRPDIFGVEVSEFGDIYEGEYQQGMKWGNGKLNSMNGSSYLGQFYESVRSGFGRLEIGNQTFVGDFKDNQYHGFGYLREKGGSTYFGHFKDGKRFGLGFEVTQQDEYKGEWVQDLRNGVGIVKKRKGGRVDREYRRVRYIDGKIVSLDEEDVPPELGEIFSRYKIEAYFRKCQKKFQDIERSLFGQNNKLEDSLALLPHDLYQRKEKLEELIEQLGTEFKLRYRNFRKELEKYLKEEELKKQYYYEQQQEEQYSEGEYDEQGKKYSRGNSRSKNKYEGIERGQQKRKRNNRRTKSDIESVLFNNHRDQHGREQPSILRTFSFEDSDNYKKMNSNQTESAEDTGRLLSSNHYIQMLDSSQGSGAHLMKDRTTLNSLERVEETNETHYTHQEGQSQSKGPLFEYQDSNDLRFMLSFTPKTPAYSDIHQDAIRGDQKRGRGRGSDSPLSQEDIGFPHKRKVMSRSNNFPKNYDFSYKGEGDLSTIHKKTFDYSENTKSDFLMDSQGEFPNPSPTPLDLSYQYDDRGEDSSFHNGHLDDTEISKSRSQHNRNEGYFQTPGSNNLDSSQLYIRRVLTPTSNRDMNDEENQDLGLFKKFEKYKNYQKNDKMTSYNKEESHSKKKSSNMNNNRSRINPDVASSMQNLEVKRDYFSINNEKQELESIRRNLDSSFVNKGRCIPIILEEDSKTSRPIRSQTENTPPRNYQGVNLFDKRHNAVYKNIMASQEENSDQPSPDHLGYDQRYSNTESPSSIISINQTPKTRFSQISGQEDQDYISSNKDQSISNERGGFYKDSGSNVKHQYLDKQKHVNYKPDKMNSQKNRFDSRKDMQKISQKQQSLQQQYQLNRNNKDENNGEGYSNPRINLNQWPTTSPSSRNPNQIFDTGTSSLVSPSQLPALQQPSTSYLNLSPDPFSIEKRCEMNSFSRLDYFDVNLLEADFECVACQGTSIILGGLKGLSLYKEDSEGEVNYVLENSDASACSILSWQHGDLILVLSHDRLKLSLFDKDLKSVRNIYCSSAKKIAYLNLVDDKCYWVIDTSIHTLSLSKMIKSQFRDILEDEIKGEIVRVCTGDPRGSTHKSGIVCLYQCLDGSFGMFTCPSFNTKNRQEIVLSSLEHDLTNLKSATCSINSLNRYFVLGGSFQKNRKTPSQPCLVVVDFQQSPSVTAVKLLDDIGRVEKMVLEEFKFKDYLLVSCTFSAYLMEPHQDTYLINRHFNLTGFNDPICNMAITESTSRIYFISKESQKMRVQVCRPVKSGKYLYEDGATSESDNSNLEMDINGKHKQNSVINDSSGYKAIKKEGDFWRNGGRRGMNEEASEIGSNFKITLKHKIGSQSVMEDIVIGQEDQGHSKSMNDPKVDREVQYYEKPGFRELMIEQISQPFYSRLHRYKILEKVQLLQDGNNSRAGESTQRSRRQRLRFSTRNQWFTEFIKQQKLIKECDFCKPYELKSEDDKIIYQGITRLESQQIRVISSGIDCTTLQIGQSQILRIENFTVLFSKFDNFGNNFILVDPHGKIRVYNIQNDDLTKNKSSVSSPQKINLVLNISDFISDDTELSNLESLTVTRDLIMIGIFKDVQNGGNYVKMRPQNNPILPKIKLQISCQSDPQLSLDNNQLLIIGKSEGKSVLKVYNLYQGFKEIETFELKNEYFIDFRRLTGTNIFVVQSFFKILMLNFRGNEFEVKHSISINNTLTDSFEILRDRIYLKLNDSDEIYVLGIQQQDYYDEIEASQIEDGNSTFTASVMSPCRKTVAKTSTYNLADQSTVQDKGYFGGEFGSPMNHN